MIFDEALSSRGKAKAPGLPVVGLESLPRLTEGILDIAMPPLRPAVPQSQVVPDSEKWSPLPSEVAGGSLASMRDHFQQREQWLEDQFTVLKAERAELSHREARLQLLHDDRRRRLQAAILVHNERSEAAEKKLKRREEAAEKGIKQREEAAINFLDEADAILKCASSRNVEKATPCPKCGSAEPLRKRPRGSAGFNMTPPKAHIP